MEDRYALMINKEGGSVVNSYVRWGIVCCKAPFKVGGKTKALAKRDWHDEDGEDTYIPSSLRFEAYDAEFELAYQGKELQSSPFNLSLAFAQITDFKRWLSGNNTTGDAGASLTIYSPFTAITMHGYLLEISDEEPRLQVVGERGNIYNETVLTFKVKFRVTDGGVAW